MAVEPEGRVVTDAARSSGGRKRCPDFARILRERPPDDSLRETVAECFYTEMAKVAHHRCGDPTLAEDALQDGLLKALDALGSFRGEAPMQFWLRRLVITACHRMRRSRKNDPSIHVPVESLGDGPEPEASEPPQEVSLLLDERLGLLSTVLEEIDADNRALLVLHEGEGVPLDELAERQGLSIDAVKGRLKRTRQKLRARLLELAEQEF